MISHLTLLSLIVMATARYIGYEKVPSCPSNVVEWREREKVTRCPDKVPYHCIIHRNTSDLYEICIARVIVRQGVTGCPWISFYGNEPIMGGKHSSCPVQNADCPQSDHKGYVTNQLYQYQACYTPEKRRSRTTSKTKCSMNEGRITEQRIDEHQHIYCKVNTLLLSLLSFVLICYTAKHLFSTNSIFCFKVSYKYTDPGDNVRLVSVINNTH